MKKCFRSAKWIYALCLSKKSKILSLAYLKADDSTLFLNRDIHMYDICMTKQNENRVAGIYNAVSVRSEADSNRCTRFCRPLPSHSAIRPLFPAYAPFLSQSRNPARKTLTPNSGRIGSANIQTFLISAKLPPNFALFPGEILVISQNSLLLPIEKKRHSIRVHDH